jgi:acetyl esterase
MRHCSHFRSVLVAFGLLLLNVTPVLAVPVGKPFVYKTVGDRELKVHFVFPADWKPEDKRPAILFFHAGSWIVGAPGQFNEHCKYLASRGMVAGQVEYRLVDRNNDEPPTVCIQDAKSAMRWLRANAGKLGVDSDHIAAGGGSAGGHLAAFLGIMDGLDDPKDDLKVSAKADAMVLFNPVFDNGPTGWGYKRVKDRYKEFSPFHNVQKGNPPAIVFVGEKDGLIPPKTVLAFQELMKKAGNRCEAMVFEGEPHDFYNFGRKENKPYEDTVEAMDKFLGSLGWLTGPPTIKKK